MPYDIQSRCWCVRPTRPGGKLSQRIAGLRLSRRSANNQEWDAQLMPNAVNGGTEDKVLQSAMPVGSHYQQVGLNQSRAADDLARGLGGMRHYCFDFNPLRSNRIDDIVQVPA